MNVRLALFFVSFYIHDWHVPRGSDWTKSHISSGFLYFLLLPVATYAVFTLELSGLLFQYISLRSGDKQHNHCHLMTPIVILQVKYRHVSSLTANLISCMVEDQFTVKTYKSICWNKPLGWKSSLIYMLIFISSHMAEEQEEKDDLKARTAAPPLTPQQTVSFVR